jgi:hypothetical protein
MTVTDADEKPESVVEWREAGSESNEDLRVGEEDGKVTWKTILAVIVSSTV